MQPNIVEEPWMKIARGKLAEENIQKNELARHLNVSRQYAVGVLTGKKKRTDAESYIMKAIYEIIEERKAK